MNKHKNMLVFVVAVAFIVTVTFLLAPVNELVAEAETAQTNSRAAAPIAAFQQERPPFQDVDISQVGRNQDASRRPGEGLGPLIMTELKRKASDGRSWDWYGRSVAIDDNVAAIGIPGDDDNGGSSGSVQLLRRNGNTWSEEAKVTASDGSYSDTLGYSVAVDGEVVVAGAPYKIGDNNEWGKGAAYVFARQGSDWFEASKLIADDGEQSDYFGYSVSVSGDVVIVGAPYDRDDNNRRGKGAAYVFRWSGSDWVQETKLTADDGQSSDYFGYSVSISGNTALIGAWGDGESSWGKGAAYVFRWDGSQWNQEHKLTASDGDYWDRFGWSVSISDEVALVGAYYDDDHGNASGSAYLYRYDGSQWVEEQKLTASDGTQYDYFGYSVSVTNNMALVGAYGNHNSDRHRHWRDGKGTAYLYRWNKSTSQWEEGAKLQASDRANGDFFGESVSLSDDVAIAGAVGDDDNGSYSGSAYLYLIDAGLIPPVINVSPTAFWVTLRAGDRTTETVTIKNLGAGDRNWSASSDSAWLSPSPSFGTATSAIPGSVTLNIDATSLEPGEYEGQLVISADGQTVTVLVWLTVSALGDVPIVNPAYGLDNVSTLIYIQGSDFDDSTTVALGSEVLEIQYIKSGLLSALVPTGLKSGSYNVTVQTGDGDPITAPNAYEVIRSTVVNDLLSSSDWLWSWPYPLQLGSSNSSVGVLVQQLGGRASINEVTVEFRVDSPVGPLLGRAQTNVIEPFGIVSTHRAVWEPEGGGEYVVCAIIDPDNEVRESNEENNTVCRTLTVLPYVYEIILPEIENPGGFVISDDIHTTPEITVTLDITATGNPYGSGAQSVKYIEFEYSLGAHRWILVQQTPWMSYATAHSDYPWRLVPSFGMRYMQAWVADGAGNISLRPGVDVINLLPSEQPGSIAKNGVDFYRVLLDEGETFTATLQPVDGDPDLYVWGPNGQLWYDPDGPVGIEQVIIDSAPVKGTYQIEIHGFSDAEYLLEFNPTDSGAMPTFMDDPFYRTSRGDRPIPGWKKIDQFNTSPHFFDIEAPPVVEIGETRYLPIIIGSGN